MKLSSGTEKKTSFSISTQTQFTIKPNPKMIYFLFHIAVSRSHPYRDPPSGKEATQGHNKWNKLWEKKDFQA